MTSDASLDLATFETHSPKDRVASVRQDSRGCLATLIALGDACERLAAGEPARALLLGDLIAETATSLDEPIAFARALRATVPALAYQGRLNESLARADDAMNAATLAQDVIEHARSGIASMHALAKLGRTHDAILRGVSARDVLRARSRDDLSARAELNLANVYKMRGEHREAIACLNHALLGVPESESSARGTIENTLGETLLQLDSLALAAAAFDRAEELLRPLPLAHAVVIGNRADLFSREGRFGDALREFARAQSLVSATAPGHHARLLLEEAETLLLLGAHADALVATDAALSTASAKGLHAELVRGCLVRARALIAAGRAAEATPDAARALTLARESCDARGIRAAALVACELALFEGNPSQALLHAAIAREGDSELDIARADICAAHAQLAMNNPENALQRARSARSTAEALGVRIVEIDAAVAQADCERALGRIDHCIESLTHAVSLAEDIRGTLAAQRHRSAFASACLRPYENLALDLLARGDATSLGLAFATVERARSRVLLDTVLRSIDRTCATTVDDGELARLRARLSALHASAAREAPTQPEPGSPSNDLRRESVRHTHAQMLELMREHERSLDLLVARGENARGVQSMFAQPLDTESIVDALESGDALLAYFSAGDELFAFVAHDGTLSCVRAIAHTSDLAPLIEKFLFQLRSTARDGATPRNTRATQVLSRALYDVVIDPIMRSRIDVALASRLVVVPFGTLHALPFAALFDGTRFLIERFEIHTAPSASIACRRRPTSARKLLDRALVIGVADQHAPLISREIKQIAALSPCDVLEGAQATIAAVRGAVRARRCIHLACHGRFIASLPMASGLKLADAWMPVRDLLELELDADLVVLTGCETGRHAVDAGEELTGIARAFLAAGARCVVTTLWPVRDAVAIDIATDFHRRLLAKQRPSAALREAMLAARQNTVHPAWWAPFVVLGTL